MMLTWRLVDLLTWLDMVSPSVGWQLHDRCGLAIFLPDQVLELLAVSKARSSDEVSRDHL